MHVPNSRRLVTMFASAALIAGTALIGAVPAQAAPAAETAGHPLVSTAAATNSADAISGLSVAEQASSYWTAERMRTAISADALVKGAKVKPGKEAGPTGAAQSVPPAAATTPQVTGLGGATASGSALLVNASPTVGKVFFYNPADGKNYVCSAGTVNSGSKLLVMSAGHCVHGGRGGQWMQNWIFVPLYDYGYEPYGRWSAKYLTTFTAWINNSDLDRDVAFITMWPNSSGQRPVDVLGGNGISVNYSHQQYVTILAYPAAPPYDGGWQWACEGTTFRPGIWPFQENKIALRCGFTGGSSGSVWLRLYNGAYGYVNGIMSTLSSDGTNKSSYFDTAVMDVYYSVADRT
ncbi:MAG TPA: hypothetical protein VFX60_08420 [Micromonospora sp.]|nr:hypothetical protein [Micromonospora sp.]